MDWTLNLTSIMTALGLVIGFVGWLIRLEGRANQGFELAKKVDALTAQLALLREQFHEYQLASAEKFMTQDAVSELKRELIVEISRMEGRLEAQIDRIAPRQQSRTRNPS